MKSGSLFVQLTINTQTDTNFMGYFCDFRKNDIWRMIAVVAVVLAAAAFLISALPDGSDGVQSGTCGDDVTWVLNDDGVLMISGSGPMYNYDGYYDDGAELVSPFADKSFEKVIIEYGVTSIGDVAFTDSYILNLEIANSVTYIGRAAFFGGSGLESVVIPDSVGYIGDSAFGMHAELKTVVLPDSLSYIGDGAFDNTPIKSIELPSALTFIGDSLLLSSPITSITIPPSVTYIGCQAFLVHIFGRCFHSSLGCPDQRWRFRRLQISGIHNNPRLRDQHRQRRIQRHRVLR